MLVNTYSTSDNYTLFSKSGTTNVNLETNGTMQIYEFSAANGGNGGNAGSSFNFDGGTLRAIASANMMPGSIFAGGASAGVYVQAGGAILDSNGNNPSISANLLHGGPATDGGVTKVGSGSWTLNGSNSYNGGTTVSGGTLQLGNTSTGAATGPLTINSATLDLNGNSPTWAARRGFRRQLDHQQLAGRGPYGRQRRLVRGHNPRRPQHPRLFDLERRDAGAERFEHL